MEATSSFGYWVRRRRKALDLTQAELARQVACTLSTIKKIEFDERRPSRLMAERLAECLQIPGSERAEFIKIARAVHSPQRLGVENEPLTTGITSERKTNLPLSPTRLIGRLEQIAGICALLRKSEVHLVTLSGPGGVGKTRLALQVARELAGEYADGVWLVELAALANPALVAQAAVSALKLPGSGSRPPLEVLLTFLSSRQVLLVLDNCEHLLEGVAELAHALLCECPGLDLLCTSREILNTPEEYTWLVPPLSLPDIKSSPSLETLSENEAVGLFLDRAMHVQPTFSLTEQNANGIAHICCRMGGLPLAIELAAARVRVLSVSAIHAHLDDALHLLEGGFRTAAARQQTMQAAIEWNYKLLSPSEQALLRRLSVFAGGWTLEAAEEVCPSPGNVVMGELPPAAPILKRDNVLSLLGGLVSKSMVTCLVTSEQEDRYGMLEPIRQFADQKLFEAGEVDKLRQRHLEYYLGMAELASPELNGPEQVHWLKLLDLQLENLRQALDWGFKTAPSLGLRLAAALTRFWNMRNLHSEGIDWLTRLLELPENKQPSITRARGLGRLASLAVRITPLPEIWAHESLAITESLQDEPGKAFALYVLGQIGIRRRDDAEQARSYLAESLEIYRATSDRHGMANALLHLSDVMGRYEGNVNTQRKYHEQALALFREVGDMQLIALAQEWLAIVIAEVYGDLSAARRMMEEVLVIHRQQDDRGTLKYSLFNYAIFLTWQGEYEFARQMFLESLELVRKSGSPSEVAFVEASVAGIDRITGRAELALPVIENTLRIMHACDAHMVQTDHLTNTILELVTILTRRGETGRARELLQEAQEKTNILYSHVNLLHRAGCLALAEREAEEALRCFRQGLELCRRASYKLLAIQIFEGMAGAFDSLGMPEQAARLLSAAAAFRNIAGAPVSPWDLPVLEELKASLRASLGSAGFAQAWEQGQALSFEEALEEALLLQPVTGGTQ